MALRAVTIKAVGVECLQDDGVARLHAQRRRALTDSGKEDFGVEMVRGHSGCLQIKRSKSGGIVAAGSHGRKP